MIAVARPGGPAGAVVEVRPRPTHRDVERFVIARLGVTASKARRVARAVSGEADPYAAALGRVVTSEMLRGFDPTGTCAVRRTVA